MKELTEWYQNLLPEEPEPNPIRTLKIFEWILNSYILTTQNPKEPNRIKYPNAHTYSSLNFVIAQVYVLNKIQTREQSFCGETEEEHEETLTLVREVRYDMAYMFAYSMREKTHAHRNYTDDVPEEVKQRRLSELIEAFRETTGPCYDSQIGSVQLVLVEGPNKRAPETELIGKTDKGHRVSFIRKPLIEKECLKKRDPEIGDFVEVKIEKSTKASLYGEALAISKLSLFHHCDDDVVVVASCAS